ncbi:MAG: Type site-specific deoxyribonuclease [Conexibacter sp.]|nr:Type site-specific deoxyribonuclease [Conexibacter sp.]
MNREEFESAIRSHWEVRTGQQDKQLALGKADAGRRGAVTGGAHMDAMALVMERIFIDAGFPAHSISRSSSVELPGYFRPEKKWDLVVVHEGTLAAAIEFKSQVGPSFGNNYNNRTEEAIGSATDVWTAFREGRFGTARPWLGYLFLLEEAPKSTSPVRVREPFYEVDPVFKGASYKQRYEIFCRRLLLERLYDAVCFVTSSADLGSPIHEPAHDLDFAAFMAAIRARAAYLLAANR